MGYELISVIVCQHCKHTSDVDDALQALMDEGGLVMCRMRCSRCGYKKATLQFERGRWWTDEELNDMAKLAGRDNE